MFPNPQDAPAIAAEGAGDEPVAGLVAGDLGPPELRVCLRLRGVDRTPVPSDLFPEATSVFINNRTVRKHRHWHHIFLHRNRVVKITPPVDELL